MNIYEVRFLSDEGYYTIGIFASQEDADATAKIGNDSLDTKWNSFVVHAYKVFPEGTVLPLIDIKMELEDKLDYVDDYFIASVEDDEID